MQLPGRRKDSNSPHSPRQHIGPIGSDMGPVCELFSCRFCFSFLTNWSQQVESGCVANVSEQFANPPLTKHRRKKTLAIMDVLKPYDLNICGWYSWICMAVGHIWHHYSLRFTYYDSLSFIVKIHQHRYSYRCSHRSSHRCSHRSRHRHRHHDAAYHDQLISALSLWPSNGSDARDTMAVWENSEEEFSEVGGCGDVPSSQVVSITHITLWMHRCTYVICDSMYIYIDR